MLVLVHDENTMQDPFVILGDTIKRTTFYLHQYYDKKKFKFQMNKLKHSQH